MRLLVTAASTALIAALTLSVSATAPSAGVRSSPASATQVSTMQVRVAQVRAAQVRAAQVNAAGPALPTAAAVTDTTTPTGADAAAAPADTIRFAPRKGFAWPLSPPPAVLRRFEQPRVEWSRGHRGVDLSASVGQPVLSAGDGVVAFSGVIAGRGVITVRHSGGLRTTYEPVDERLASGSVVRRGANVAAVSPTPGHCAPLTCLHWGVISGRTYRDPLSLLGFGRPILLPLG